MTSNSPNQKKKILLRLPRVKGFAIDNITILPNIEDCESSKGSVSSPQKFSTCFKSAFPATPSNNITWKFNSNKADKHSSPLPESNFSSIGSFASLKSFPKYMKFRRSSYKQAKFSERPHLTQCESCNVTKAIQRNLSTKSSKINDSFTSNSSNRIKRSLFIIQGTLLTRLPKK